MNFQEENPARRAGPPPCTLLLSHKEIALMNEDSAEDTLVCCVVLLLVSHGNDVALFFQTPIPCALSKLVFISSGLLRLLWPRSC